MKKLAVLFLSGILLLSAPMTVLADSSSENQTYISLGADLNQQERATVLNLLGVTEQELSNYKVTEVTNKEEHEYLDGYLSSSIIGSRALSSVKVEGKEDGYGVKVSTQNITYCTTEMYQNALVTAGIKNAEVKVVGPSGISGTAGLVGAIKSYEEMTGKKVSEESADTATNELVITSDIGKDLEDPEKAAELVAFVKNEVVAQNLSEEEIGELVDEASSEFEINLSEEDRQRIIDLMEKIKDLDLDVNQLQEQISNLYDRLDSMGLDINSEQVQGFLDKLIDLIKSFIDKLTN